MYTKYDVIANTILAMCEWFLTTTLTHVIEHIPLINEKSFTNECHKGIV